MSEDTDLARIFSQSAESQGGEAFVAGVTTRLARDRLLRLALPFAVAALLLAAVWITWPAAKSFATESLGSIDLLARGMSGFFNSDAGTLAAAAVTLSLAIWAFATGRLRSLLR